MVVTIEFLGIQRTVTKTDGIAMPITENMRVNDALEYVKRLYPGIQLDGGMLVTVNREIASLDRLLRANDIVSFIPSISGG